MQDLLGDLLLATRQDGILGAALLFAFVCVTLALVLTSIRLLRGPTLPDRVVALDLISVLLLALLALFTVASAVSAYMDAALVLAAVAFLGTVALARFVLRSRRDYSRPTRRAEEER